MGLITTRISRYDRMLLVERQFTHTVDGVVDVLTYLGHTVLGTLQHHAGAEHAAEVGTLDGVQQTAGIDGTETVRFEIGRVLRRSDHIFVCTIQELQVFLLCQRLTVVEESTIKENSWLVLSFYSIVCQTLIL